MLSPLTRSSTWNNIVVYSGNVNERLPTDYTLAKTVCRPSRNNRKPLLHVSRSKWIVITLRFFWSRFIDVNGKGTVPLYSYAKIKKKKTWQTYYTWPDEYVLQPHFFKI